MRLQHQRRDAVAAKHVGKGLHGRAIKRGGAEDQCVRAGPAGLLHNIANGIFCHVAIEQQIEQSSPMRIGDRFVHSFPLVAGPHRTGILLKQ